MTETSVAAGIAAKRLTPAFAFKLASVEEAQGNSGAFAGYASTFGGPADSYGDVIAPGAFARSLAEHKTAGSLPALLWQHDSHALIGKWLSIVEDGRGLAVAGKLTLEVQRAREAYALLRDGALNGLSIGFRTRASKLQKGGGRVLTDIELLEISLVTLPANAAARVGDVKGAGSITTIRDYEAALRDGLGFTPRAAKRLAAGGWPALAEREVRDGRDELAAALKRAARWFSEQTERIPDDAAS